MPALYDERLPYFPPRTGLAAGGTPAGFDVAEYLRNDPVLAAQMLGISGNVSSRLAGLQEQDWQDVIGYGNIPAGYDVPEHVRLAAEKATAGGLSTWAQMQDAYRMRRSQGIGSLGARNIVRSSGFGSQAKLDAQALGVSRAQALGTLNQALYGRQQQGLQAQQEGLGQRVTAEQSALDRLYDMIKSGIIAAPGPATQANPTVASPGSTAAAAATPRAAPFVPAKAPQIPAGQPGNTFQSVPNRGRALVSGPTYTPAAPLYGVTKKPPY